MGVKYYTHFVLDKETGVEGSREFSGIVEINRATGHHIDTKEIEALLAKNFDVRLSDLRLIDWARLH